MTRATSTGSSRTSPALPGPSADHQVHCIGGSVIRKVLRSVPAEEYDVLTDRSVRIGPSGLTPERRSRRGEATMHPREGWSEDGPGRPGLARRSFLRQSAGAGLLAGGL